MRTPSKQTLSEQIYEILRENIVKLKFPSGERLNIRELESQLGVSSTPLREAISRLHQEGLVEYVTNVGAKVIDITREDVIEIINLACLLDCGAIEFALKLGKHNELATELLESIHSYQIEFGKQTCYTHVFHRTFYKYANNSRLAAMQCQLSGQFEILRSKYYRFLPPDSHDHEAIYKALSVGDVQTATECMKKNYSIILNRLLSHI